MSYTLTTSDWATAIPPPFPNPLPISLLQPPIFTPFQRGQQLDVCSIRCVCQRVSVCFVNLSCGTLLLLLLLNSAIGSIVLFHLCSLATDQGKIFSQKVYGRMPNNFTILKDILKCTKSFVIILIINWKFTNIEYQQILTSLPRFAKYIFD